MLVGTLQVLLMGVHILYSYGFAPHLIQNKNNDK